MANSSFFGYSYFSGANVFIKINGIPALETAGITYSVQESTAPIYGYSSRIFDAVAMGQKIIRGSFVINFIAPNYIARIIELGRAGLNIENVQQIFGKSDFSQELKPLEDKLEDALKAQADLEIQYKEARQILQEELNPAIRRISLKEDALSVYQDSLENLKINNEAARIEIEKHYAKRAGDIAPLIGYDPRNHKYQVEELLSEKELKEALGKNNELRNIELRKVNEKAKFMEEIYRKNAEQLAQQIQNLKQEIKNQKIDLDLDYEAVALSQGTSVVNFKKEIQQMKKDLEDENKSLVQKEIASRTLLNNKLNQIKNSRNYISVQQAINSMNALEKISTAYYSNSMEGSMIHGVNNINDIGLLGPFNIDIQFAEEYTIRIIDAFLTSRGSMIQIDENAIVEEYSFFARDIKYF